MLLGGPIIAGDTLSRFFALHVFVIPGLLIGFVSLHLLMVLKLGINEWPMPGRMVRRSTYVQEYHELTHKDGVPFVPDAVWKDMFFSAAIIVCVMACAAYFGPFGPSGYPDPTIIQTIPKPDFFFLWLYAMLALLPPAMETPAAADRSGHRHRLSDAAAVLLRRRREELEAAPDRGGHDAADRGRARHLHPAGHLFSLEPGHERLERRSRSGGIS